MMRWLCLLLAWVGVVYLLSLGDQQATVTVNDHPHADWNNSSTRSVSTSSIASLQTSTESTHSRAGPLESFGTHSGSFTMDDVGPPWLDDGAPPGTCEEHWGHLRSCRRPAAHAGDQTTVLPRNSPRFSSKIKNAGVLQQPLASHETHSLIRPFLTKMFYDSPRRQADS